MSTYLGLTRVKSSRFNYIEFQDSFEFDIISDIRKYFDLQKVSDDCYSILTDVNIDNHILYKPYEECINNYNIVNDYHETEVSSLCNYINDKRIAFDAFIDIFKLLLNDLVTDLHKHITNSKELNEYINDFMKRYTIDNLRKLCINETSTDDYSNIKYILKQHEK